MGGNVLRESVISMSEATKAFPRAVHRSTLHRWVVEGINGVRLEVARMGARHVTSHEAVERFLQSVNARAGAA